MCNLFLTFLKCLPLTLPLLSVLLFHSWLFGSFNWWAAAKFSLQILPYLFCTGQSHQYLSFPGAKISPGDWKIDIYLCVKKSFFIVFFFFFSKVILNTLSLLVTNAEYYLFYLKKQYNPCSSPAPENHWLHVMCCQCHYTTPRLFIFGILVKDIW